MMGGMLTQLSNELADVVAKAAPSVMQVLGRRRPATGLVYADEVVLTTMRALGREEGLRVRRHDGQVLDAEFAGWDVATTLALLRVPGLGAPPATLAGDAPRVGQLGVAIARSWSNAPTASLGLVAVIGGPLRTSRRHAIEEVIRITAPMHDGFSGGALLDAGGGVIGVTTAAAIRGLGVVIPAPIAWKAAAHVLEHGRGSRGYLGVFMQAVQLPEHQRTSGGHGAGALILGVADNSPAADARLIVGDIVVALGGQAVGAPEDVLDLLARLAPGSAATLTVLRGGVATDVPITVRERPSQ
jgi:S1-C subfamily serine protease